MADRGIYSLTWNPNHGIPHKHSFYFVNGEAWVRHAEKSLLDTIILNQRLSARKVLSPCELNLNFQSSATSEVLADQTCRIFPKRWRVDIENQ